VHRRLPAILIGSLALAAIAAGCGGGGGPLARDDEVRLLTTANRDLQAKLEARDHELAALRAAGATPAPVVRPPEDPFRPVALQFGEFTGVLDADAGPAVSRLKVVLEPVDADSEIVKRAGSLDLAAYEPGAPGHPPLLYHRWTLPAAELVQTWIGMFGIHGYVLKLPWPDGRPPTASTLILRAKFTTLTGESFTAETTIPVPQAKMPATGAPPHVK
jgi:hypothetical protein